MPPSVAVSARATRDRARLKLAFALLAFEKHWSTAFVDVAYDPYLSALFTRAWLKGGKPVPRREAYAWMAPMSEQTAMKYLNRALAADYLLEVENPDDRRSRLVAMTPRLQTMMNQLMDAALAEVGGAGV